MEDGRGLPASGNAAGFLHRDHEYRDRDLGTKRKDGKLASGRCVSKTEQGTDCDTVAFAEDSRYEGRRLPYKVKMAILLEREDAAITEKLKEYGVRPQPGTVCWCGSTLAALTRKCMIDEEHEVPPAPEAAPRPPRLGRWT
jgi:hypothetical protein